MIGEFLMLFRHFSGLVYSAGKLIAAGCQAQRSNRDIRPKGHKWTSKYRSNLDAKTSCVSTVKKQVSLQETDADATMPQP